MNEEPYEMRELFLENMAGTHKSLFVADKLIQKLLPKLAYHFKRESIHISMFATQWVMTIFASTFPFDLVARVWDSFIVEGWKVVYRITLALLDYATPELLELSIEEVFDYFREFPQKIDGQAIINASLNIPLKNKLIRKYTDEWNKVQNRGNDIFHRKVSSDSNASSASGTRIIQRSKLSLQYNIKSKADDVSGSKSYLDILSLGAKTSSWVDYKTKVDHVTHEGHSTDDELKAFDEKAQEYEAR
eukprot:scaffold249_cov186-Alexandrium_tamarense.AAC.1